MPPMRFDVEVAMPRHTRGFDTQAAYDHLAKRDRKLGAWMKRIGAIDPEPRWRKPFDPVDALARAILYQQFSGKAAATIVGRVEVAIGSDRLHCDTLARSNDAALRACGVSGNKLLALRDLALRESRGEIPALRQMATMDNDAIIDALVPVRGIGRWTVEMMLMFRLGRPDVLPIDDLGIRKGAQIVDKLDVMLAPKVLAERGERWSPHRTYASFYLWRIADFGAQAKAPAKAPTKRSQD
jgi:DNA-3-methyladenine glycosylase II